MMNFDDGIYTRLRCNIYRYAQYYVGMTIREKQITPIFNVVI